MGFYVESGFQIYVGRTKLLIEKDTIVNMKCNNSSFARVCPFFALTGWNSTGCPKEIWKFSDELDIVFVMN